MRPYDRRYLKGALATVLATIPLILLHGRHLTTAPVTVIINTLLTFLIVALAIFMLVKVINRLYQRPAEPTPNTTPCPYCTMTISRQASRCPHCTSEVAAA